MSKIEQIVAREIFDTRGNPTIETTVVLTDGTVAKSSVPTGATKGTYEAQHLRDNDPNRYFGMGVLKAVDVVNREIAQKLTGMEASEQQEIDKLMIELDGTQNKIKLGGNSILSVSQAVCKAAAKSSLLPLSLYIRQFISRENKEHKIPSPMFNLIEGGKHANNNLNFQQFLLIPASSHTLSESMEIGITVYKKLREYLIDNNQSVLNADDGGFAPSYATNADAFKTIRVVIERTPYAFLRDVFLGVDIAANAFLSSKKYTIKDKNGQLDQDDLIEIYQGLLNDFSLVYFEDPFAEDDWDGWKKMYTSFASKALIVGDDITSTNPYRLQSALNNNVLSAIVIKPNQIGTVTEALAVAEIARFKQLKIIVSARSGETDDDFIADFAVAVDADYVKFGAPARERIIKYNRLLAIEQELTKSKLS
ncbi:MAG: phosphopyruvate hydratase [Candidatus Levybacteria bacterium]|nr:phosphopyruvate hydratase [Candidatus Levybacteria bacterium]